MNRKKRRHSGYNTPQQTIPTEEIDAYDWFITPRYSDWDDHRDGMRDRYGDRTLLKEPPERTLWNASLVEKRARANQKLRRLIARRKRQQARRAWIAEREAG